MDCLTKVRANASPRGRLLLAFTFMIFAAALSVQTASATDCSTSSALASPGTTVFPADCTSTPAGTLLASLSAPFNSASGKLSGTIVSAVYQESGGTLDFYYQVTDNSSCSKPPCDAITRETDTDFSGFTTGLATRTDGGSLGSGDPFVNGTVFPFTGDRNLSGDVIGWTFAVQTGQITPGTSSLVLIITTNATHFGVGNAFAIDGGVTQVAAFAPAATVPEPSSIVLFGTGALGLLGAIRRKLLG